MIVDPAVDRTFEAFRPKGPIRKIKFLTGWQARPEDGHPVVRYNTGERIGLPVALAERLVATHVAVFED